MSEELTPCPECGRLLLRAQRWGGADGPADVLVCLVPVTGGGCGYEEPPLYRRGRAARDRNDDYRPLGPGYEEEIHHGR